MTPDPVEAGGRGPTPVLVPVLPAHHFDEVALLHYLAPRVEGLGATVAIRQFQGGQSNPTFLLEGAARPMVLRKKPPGALLRSAHQVEREFRVISALYGSAVPVPRPILLCEDDSVIGTPFYLMDYVEGRVYPRLEYVEGSPEETAALWAAMCETMAALHGIDWKAAGLSDFGRPEGYLERQIDRWSRQYEASVVDVADPAMARLAAWLRENRPRESRTTIAHGDFRFGNMVFAPKTPRVAAVLDWELATLGDPLSDLAYCCLPYHLPADQPGVRGLLGCDLARLGVPREEEFIDAYCRRSGRSGIPDWPFYLAFALFRLAAIVQGVYARGVRGNASSANAAAVGGRASLFIATGWSLATQGQAVEHC